MLFVCSFYRQFPPVLVQGCTFIHCRMRNSFGADSSDTAGRVSASVEMFAPDLIIFEMSNISLRMEGKNLPLANPDVCLNRRRWRSAPRFSVHGACGFHLTVVPVCSAGQRTGVAAGQPATPVSFHSSGTPARRTRQTLVA